MFGQFGHFFKYAKDKCEHPYPLERYATEARRILKVLDNHLQDKFFLVGENYSIADMATVPWVNGLSQFYKAEEKLSLNEYTHVNRWVKNILERPLTSAGMKVCAF
jgi:GST-like protein